MLAVFAAGLHRIVDLLVADRIGVAEGQVFQLAADFAHAQAVGQRCINLQRLLGDLLLPLFRQRRQGAHVVQPVGQLDEHHADVINHGQQHLADVFRLALFLAGQIDHADLGDAFHNVRHLRSELALNVFLFGRGVFH